jgi:hypothetical protein
MADWKREIGAITLYVPDLGEARKFYADAFGLDAQPVDDDTAMLRFGNIFVFLGRSSAAAQPLPEVLEQAGKGAGQFAIIADPGGHSGRSPRSFPPRTADGCPLIHRRAVPGPLPRHRRQLLQALRQAPGQRRRPARTADHRDPRPAARPDRPKTYIRPDPRRTTELVHRRSDLHHHDGPVESSENRHMSPGS